MIIRDLTSGAAAAARARISATIEWEDTDRPPLEIFFQTDARFARDLTLDPNAFVLAAIVPAMLAGERRIQVKEAVCPVLCEGLETAMRWLSYWWDRSLEAPHIDAPRRTEGRHPAPRESAVFFTGGIDSLAAVRRNRLQYPPGHPGAFSFALITYGFNFDSDPRMETYEHAVRELSDVAEDAGLTLLSVESNVRKDLNPHGDVWAHQFAGAALSSVAHAFSRRLARAAIASSADLPNLLPYGTHPVLDVNYSSWDLRIWHESAELSRYEKARLVAGWEAGLQNVKVCTANWPGLNCGACEKCMRTMLGLEAAGALDRCRAFGGAKLSPDRVREVVALTADTVFYFTELIEPLRARGSNDLAAAVEHVVGQYQRETGLKGVVRRLDRQYFDGHLTPGLKRLLSRPDAQNRTRTFTPRVR